MKPKYFNLFFSFIICLFVYSFIGLFTPPAHAQSQDWVGQGYGTALDQARMDGAINSDSYVTDVTYKNMAAIACAILPVPGENGCTNDVVTFQSMLKGSAIGQINNMIAFTYSNQPARTYAFIQDMGQSLGFMPKQAYAQGIGFSGLANILPLWKMFRNISYGLLAIVMVIIGLMVMLRKKIDPKTVVTVQNALPRIVITLLLITFSYAIAGLLIDLMYFLIILVVAILTPASNGALGPETASKYLGGGSWTLLWAMFGGSMSTFDDLVKLISWNSGFGLLGLASQIGWMVSAWWLFLLILLCLFLYGYIKILFMLVGAYIQIVLAVIFSPFQLLFDAFPGSNGFSSWLINLVANLAVFPVTAAMLAVGTILTRADPAFPVLQGGTSLWVPPFLSGGQGSGGYVGILGLGILLTIPSVAGLIKEALKSKAPVSVGVGTVVAPFASTAGLAWQGAYQFGFISHGISSIFNRGGEKEKHA